MDPRVAAALKVEDEKYSAGTIGGEKYVNLRDEFAKAAMHQILHGAVLPVGYDSKDDFAHVAAKSYEMADAMLAARNA